MGFFERTRHRAQERTETARQGYEKALVDTTHAVNERDAAENSLRFTETRNAELRQDEEEVIRLELQEEIARRRLALARSNTNTGERAALEKEHQTLLDKLNTIRARIQSREQELRKDFGLPEQS